MAVSCGNCTRWLRRSSRSGGGSDIRSLPFPTSLILSYHTWPDRGGAVAGWLIACHTDGVCDGAGTQDNQMSGHLYDKLGVTDTNSMQKRRPKIRWHR